jgi:hypothetical protein
MARAVEQGGPMPTGMTRHEAVNQGLASLQAKPKPSCWAAALGAISLSRTGRSPGEIFESILKYNYAQYRRYFHQNYRPRQRKQSVYTGHRFCHILGQLTSQTSPPLGWNTTNTSMSIMGLLPSPHTYKGHKLF